MHAQRDHEGVCAQDPDPAVPPDRFNRRGPAALGQHARDLVPEQELNAARARMAGERSGELEYIARRVFGAEIRADDPVLQRRQRRFDRHRLGRAD